MEHKLYQRFTFGESAHARHIENKFFIYSHLNTDFPFGESAHARHFENEFSICSHLNADFENKKEDKGYWF